MNYSWNISRAQTLRLMISSRNHLFFPKYLVKLNLMKQEQHCSSTVLRYLLMVHIPIILLGSGANSKFSSQIPTYYQNITHFIKYKYQEERNVLVLVAGNRMFKRVPFLRSSFNTYKLPDLKTLKTTFNLTSIFYIYQCCLDSAVYY